MQIDERMRPAMTHRELAERFGVCKQRILELERRAIKKLRRAITEEAKAAGKSPRDWLWGE